MQNVELNRVELDTTEKVKLAVKEAWERHNGTPIGERFLSTGVVAGCLLYKVQLPLAILAADAAHGAEHNYVESVKSAHIPLFNICTAYMNEMMGHVKCNGLSNGYFLYFGMGLDGNHLDMTTDQFLLDASDAIALGNAQMVTEGIPVNTAFTAAMVAALRAPFLVVVNTKTAKKQASANAELAESNMEILAKGFGDDVYHEVKAHTEALHLEIGAARDLMRTYGVHFEAPKVKTLLKTHVLIGLGANGAGAEVRYGPVLTTRGKKSKEGVKGNADAQGHFERETTESEDVYVNVRLLNFADAHVAVPAFEPGDSLALIVVQMVPGVSSL